MTFFNVLDSALIVRSVSPTNYDVMAHLKNSDGNKLGMQILFIFIFFTFYQEKQMIMFTNLTIKSKVNCLEHALMGSSGLVMNSISNSRWKPTLCFMAITKY